jgi:hypothetical protein
MDEEQTSAAPVFDFSTLTVRDLGSVALARIIEEVRVSDSDRLDTTAYNRTYHRHNR